MLNNVDSYFLCHDTIIFLYGLNMLVLKKYLSVGIINTLIHWSVFYIFLLFGFKQSQSNLIAFVIAVTFSFFVNGIYTFNSNVSFLKYVMYVVFMGGLAVSVGYFSDKIKLPSIFTLIIFSIISLAVGFLYSKFIIFKEIK